MRKKLTALLVVVLMVFALIPTIALAEEEPEMVVQTVAPPTLSITVVTKLGDQVLDGIQGGSVSQQVSPHGGRWYITPSANYGFDFEGFEGPVYRDSGQYCVDRNGDKAVTAVFKMNLDYFKILKIQTFGDGSVGASPAGITIGGNTYYAKNTNVTLTPSAAHGWRFDKWGGDTDDNTVKMSGDKCVEAHFVKCVYPIKFKVGAHGTWTNNQTYPVSVNTAYGEMPNAPTIKPHTGYEFTTWSPALEPAEEGDEYTAQYAPITYPITYDLDNGSATNPGSYTIETDTFTLNNPTRPGYSFAGWSGTSISDGAMIVTISKGSWGARSYKALWTPIGYTVTYDKTTGDGGTTADSLHKYDVAADLTDNGYYKAGYTFAGWSASAEGTTVDYTDGQSVLNLTDVDDDVVKLYAVWKIKTFNVSFYQQDGTTKIGTTQTVNWNTAATLETAPAIVGYTFDKWILTGDDATQSDSLTNVKENIKAVASYVRNAYLVTFLDSQGKTIGTQTVLHGDPATAPAAPAVVGYTFTGWDKAFDKITSALTVTAQYKINTFTVKFVDFDGKVLSTQTVNYGSPAVAPVNPARSGYTFTVWDKDYSKIISDLTVTAQYKQNVSSDDEDIPGTFDSGSQPFPWLWVVVAFVLAGAIVTILVTQAKRHKKADDAV